MCSLKKFIFTLGMLVAFSTVATFANGKSNLKNGGSDKKLKVWSFTDEIEDFLNAGSYGYKATHPDVKIEYSMIPTDQFPGTLDPVLASGQGAPDVFALESAFVRKYVESELLLPLDDLYEELKSKIDSYPVEVGTYNNHVYAMSWQITPGAMFYRRSLAKKYLGTDDPKQVQKYFSNPDKFLETARLLKKNSKGKCRVVSAANDLFYPLSGARKEPWVKNDDTLVIDPAMEKYMDLCKILQDEELCARGCYQWSEEWFAGMNDKLFEDSSYKNPAEIFSYFLPIWGLHYVLKINAPETAGDWAMCQGPTSWYWGGTWLGAYKGTKNPELAKEMIKYLVSDDNFISNHIINSGDTPANIKMQDKYKDLFSEPYLNGQNHFKEFCDYAKKVDGSLTQGSDMRIEALWNEAVDSYMYGEKTKREAINFFKRMVKETMNLSTGDDEKKLNVMSFNDDLNWLIRNLYEPTHSDIEIDFNAIEREQYQDEIDQLLASGKKVPDIMALDSDFVKKYIEKAEDYFLPLDDMYASIKSKMTKYPAQVGTHNGHVYALSWQISPGAMFYRRSLAKKYLGTDDPKKVQKYFSSWDKFLETARSIKKKSLGKCRIISTYGAETYGQTDSGDFYRAFKASRKKPWIVKGKLFIDPAMEKYMEMCKTLADEELVTDGITMWSELWYSGMVDQIGDAKGNQVEIFSYFLPSWGIQYILEADALETSGDWAICQGPAPFYSAADTWIVAYKGTKNPELAKEMIKYITSDDDAISYFVENSGFIPSNTKVQDKFKDKFFSSYLGGQNHFKEFSDYAKKMDGTLVQESDIQIDALWLEATAYYIHGEKTKKEAIDDFKTKVESLIKK